ncbi:MAG: hypothetical protein GY762_15425 [Proteobacteria bacterium]|nr:hypothetical protein [Pseudomonadota bacterium]
MKKSWLFLVLSLALVVSMGLATGCGDDDDGNGDVDGGNGNVDGGEACTTVTGTIGIGPGFGGPATGLIVALYETAPDPTDPPDPDVIGDLIPTPTINSDTDYALSTEICGITDGTAYYTGIVVFAGIPAMPVPGDAQGVTDATDTYTAGGTVNLGDMELQVVQDMGDGGVDSGI